MNPSSSPYDFVAVGGGAAGFFAAIAFGEAAPGRRIAILEKGGSVLGKVKISGGGRCNVTHACFEPIPFTAHYPRGERNLIGPLHRWGASETVEWFANRGVELKTESDGRMFPSTDRSETVVDCLVEAARECGVDILTKHEVDRLDPGGDAWEIVCKGGERLTSRAALLSTGGIRSEAGARMAAELGHGVVPAAPSLFAFKIDDPRLADLAGVSVGSVGIRVSESRFRSTGPALVTHWGLSGPAVLKLSAWGARELFERNYRFEIAVDWCADMSSGEVESKLAAARDRFSRKRVRSGPPDIALPARLWRRLVAASGVADETTWSNLSKDARRRLQAELTAGRYLVDGKSMNKDEFVTAGGVVLDDVDFKTMESRLAPGLYFAGEILDIDGITGGFNFQSAWTTGRLAGESAARAIGST
ncbi:MAG: NAD(P)/FAD-dependent oxidoreductase [Verrucomicrobiales bacterium]